ncbi:MAG: D-alanyl-D-alanine carboxypeptidase [Lachnospiraceae bacterium]|nr:D-alanyl-D-alanine carboxypeptidase [Lachnospiraceae bacterium]
MKRMICGVLCMLLTIALCSVPCRAADKDAVDRMIASIPKDWPAAPEIQAQSAVLMDAESGEILYAKNATQAGYPASTTKLMTALLTLENCSLSDIVTFSATSVLIPANSSHIGMRRGEKMSLRECLYGLLLPSANEVANALAEHTAGSIQTFVVRMNERAFKLGCVNTVFNNANGLHRNDHYTCAYDLALIMQACIDNSVFTDIASQKSYVHHADDLLPKDIPMTNTNQMIRDTSAYYNSFAICGKTGHTDEAGYNLVTYAEKDGTNLIVVVMGCEKDGEYVATQSLLDYGFNYFHTMLPANLDESLNMENAFTDSPLQLPTPDRPLLSINATDTILVPDNVTFDMLEKTVTEADGIISITYRYQGYPLGTVTLTAKSNAEGSRMFRQDETELKPETLPSVRVVDGRVLLLIAGLILVSGAVFLYFRNMLRPKKRVERKFK